MESSISLSNHSEAQPNQQDELNQELLKYYKTSLVVSLLKQTESPISMDQRALLALYQHDGDFPLGLDHIGTVDLGYHERLAIAKFVESKISQQVKPFVDKAKRYTGGDLKQLATGQYREQHQNLQLNAERERLSNKLAKLKTRKLQLMNACAETRTGSYQRNNVELKHSEARSIQSKTELMKKLMANEIVNCTPHSAKAIKEVGNHITALDGDI